MTRTKKTKQEKKKDFKTFLQDMALGGTSGVIAKTSCAPLERVKILLQVQSASTQIAVKDHYTGILNALYRVPKEQGFFALWRGNFANCLRYFPTQAMNFAFKEKYQKFFVKPREQVGFPTWFAGYLAAGAAAGATSLTVSYPLEYTYTRLAADVGAAKSGGKRQFKGITDCIVSSIKSDGLRGIYRGYGPSVTGIVIYRAGYFGLYDFSKAVLMPMFGLSGTKKEHSPLIIFAKFLLALNIDIFSAMCAYPLDTIRRRMMMQSGRKEMLYRSSLGCARHIKMHEGLKGFYKGAWTNSVRAIGSALVLVLYDELRHVLLPGTESAH